MCLHFLTLSVGLLVDFQNKNYYSGATLKGQYWGW